MLSFIFETLRNLINFRKKIIDVSNVFARANWCLHDSITNIDDRGTIVSNNVTSVVVAGLIILVGLAVRIYSAEMMD